MKLKPGDKVAIVSPSWAGPAVYPATHELAMRRLRELLELEPVEFPTTRQQGASPAARAADLMAAWADPEIRAVFATIGGSDQITVLPHLDPAPFVADHQHLASLRAALFETTDLEITPVEEFSDEELSWPTRRR
ncbi:LD-carboxypeptidase [Paractinoplanes rhizophilus]|uniref:LD-carboxypeptidase n=1 Tax=Paractinoplanes rhizophilus TaxID=1416877 RepID=A0ABW2HRU2_9ACTN